MVGQTLTASERTELDALRDSDRMAIKLKFWSLPEPKIRDIHGDFDAQLLNQGGGMGEKLTRAFFGMRGNWLGKGFTPVSDSCGTGYNTFGTPDRYRRELRMDTYIDHSKVVPGSSFILDYRVRQRGVIRWLRGELRAMSPDLVLGLGTFGPRSDALHKLRRVIPFVLVRSDRPAEETGPSGETKAAA